MTDNETLPEWVALASPMPFDAKKLHWAKDRVYGKGSKEFLRSLHKDHYRMACATGKRGGVSKRARCVSTLALTVWRDPALRDQWLSYHKAISRLVPNL
jgi:hypothetical protein